MVSLSLNMNTVYFIEDGYWTCPPCVNWVQVTGLGGGAGGAGGNSGENPTNSGGGGGGSYMTTIMLKVEPGTPYEIIIGNGGVGGIAGNPADNGEDGGDTLFGLLYTWPGASKGLNFSYDQIYGGFTSKYLVDPQFLFGAGGAGAALGEGSKNGKIHIGGLTTISEAGSNGNPGAGTAGKSGGGGGLANSGIAGIGTGGDGGDGHDDTGFSFNATNGLSATINSGNGGGGGGAGGTDGVSYGNGGNGGSGFLIIQY